MDESCVWTMVGGRRRRRSELQSEGSDSEAKSSKQPRRVGEDQRGESSGYQRGAREGGQGIQRGGDQGGAREERRANCDDDLVVYVTGKNENITRANPINLKKDIDTVGGEGVRITKARESLRLACVDEEQKERIMRATTLAGHEVAYSEPRALARQERYAENAEYRPRRQVVKGIILGVPLDVTD